MADQRPSPSSSSTPQMLSMQMLNMATAHFVAHAVHVAAKLRVADLLADGPKSSADLAVATGTHEPSLYRLLRALAAVGVFSEEAGRQFRLTALGATLASDAPNSVQAGAEYFGEAIHWQAWQYLEHGVRTGGAGFEHAFGRPFFDYVKDDPAAAEVFDRWMTQATLLIAPAIVDAYDFSAFPVVVDVAGGQGALLAILLQKLPSARGILFDMPEVAAGAKALAGVVPPDRYEVRGGSFFDAVPHGGDAYLLKFILHDWGDADCLRILRRCREAMRPDAKLLVMEMIVPADNKPHASKFQDLSMMVLNSGGRERTEQEFRGLFLDAGFSLARILPTASPVCILECVPGA